MLTVRRTAEEETALQAEKILLLSRATVAPAPERGAAVARLRAVHHLSDSQIYSQIGATSSLCRLEENQALLVQLTATVQKLASSLCRLEENQAILLQLPATVQKLAQDTDAFRKSWLFFLWRFLHGTKA